MKLHQILNIALVSSLLVQVSVSQKETNDRKKVSEQQDVKTGVRVHRDLKGKGGGGGGDKGSKGEGYGKKEGKGKGKNKGGKSGSSSSSSDDHCCDITVGTRAPTLTPGTTAPPTRVPTPSPTLAPTTNTATLTANRQCDIFSTYSDTWFNLQIDPEQLCIDFRYMNLWTCPQGSTDLAYLLTGGNATDEYCNFLFLEPVNGGFVSRLGPDYDLNTCFTFCTEYVGQAPLDPANFDDNFVPTSGFNEGNCCSQSRTASTVSSGF